MGLKLVARDGKLYAHGSVKRLHDGKMIRIRKSTTFSTSQKREADAERLRIEYETIHEPPDTARSRHNDKTIANGITEYLALRKPQKQTVNNLIRWALDVGEDTKIADLTAELAMRLYDQLLDDEVIIENTYRRYACDICAMLEVCRQKNFPVPADLKIIKPQEGEARDRWLTAEERDLLIACCPDNIRDGVRFLAYTGARPGEMYRLVPRDIIHKNAAVFVTYKGRPKKKRVRSVPLHNEILPMVLRRVAAAEKNGGVLFPTAVGTQWSTTLWGKHFQRAVSRSKLKDVRTYDLRSTFASHLIQNGASLRAVADLLGHSGLGMVMRYAYLAPSHLKAAIDTLSSPKTAHSDTILTQTPKTEGPKGVETSDSSASGMGHNSGIPGLSEDSMSLIMVP